MSSSFWWLLPVSVLFSAAYTSIQPMGDSIILEALTPGNKPFGPIRLMGCLSFAVMNLLWGQFLAPERMNFIVYGTSFLLVVDDIARLLLSVEIPIGILTAIVGVPFFIVIFRNQARGWR